MNKNFLNTEYFSKMYDEPLNYVFFNGKPFIQDEKIKKKLKNKYEELLSIKQSKNFDDILVKSLEHKKQESLKKEKELAKSFLQNNKYPEDINKQVQFWTHFFNTIEKTEKGERNEIEDTVWLKTIFSSKEFAQKLATKKGYSSFSRNKLKKGEETKEDIESFLLNNFKEVKSLEDFEVALSSKEFDFKADLFNKINEITRNFGSRVKARSIKNMDIKINNFENLKSSIKNWGELVVKDVIERVEKSSITENKKKEIKNQLQNIQIKSKNSGEIYWIANIQEQKGKLSYYIHNMPLIEDAFYDAAKSVINDLFSDKEIIFLNIGGGRTVSLRKKDNLFEILNNDKKTRGKNVKIKSEYEANINGFLGEYLQLYSTKAISLTGDQFDSYEDSETGERIFLGESFSDAYFEEKGQKIGLNIKHYVSKFDKNSITFYDKDEVSLLSPFIRRYFSEQETKELRFLDINYNFFKEKLKVEGVENKIIEKYKQVSYNNLSRFARIDSAVLDYSNLFFVINNMYIPTSYIYHLLIESLKTKNENNKKKEYFSILFNPRSIQNTPEEENENLISRWSNGRTTASKIIFNGFTITGLTDFFK